MVFFQKHPSIRFTDGNHFSLRDAVIMFQLVEWLLEERRELFECVWTKFQDESAHCDEACLRELWHMKGVMDRKGKISGLCRSTLACGVAALGKGEFDIHIPVPMFSADSDRWEEAKIRYRKSFLESYSSYISKASMKFPQKR